MEVFTRTMPDRPPTALHATYYVFDLHPAAISLLDVLCCSLSFALRTNAKRSDGLIGESSVIVGRDDLRPNGTNSDRP
jgi:hypothetical protein